MFDWKVKDIKATNAIFLAETGDDEGRPFKSRFLQAGLVKYDFGVCLLKKETIDKFVNTFINQPVIIGHKDNIKQNDVVGYVHNIWFSPEDGWFWCDGKLIDEEAIKKVEKGFNVSCQYRITEYSNNTDKKLHNGNPYDKEILSGIFEHLAIVENPRYEDAFIAVNAYIAENEDRWITIKPNGEENKGRHLLLKDGETPGEAIQRVYGNGKQSDKEEKREPFTDKGKSKLYEKLFTTEVEKELRESVKAQQYENKGAKVGDTVIDSDKILSKFSSKLSPEEYKFFDWEEAEEFLFDKLKKIERETFKKETATNSFVEQFKDMLYETLAEGIYERLGEYIAQNEERWITIHPHGDDSEDYRRLKLKDGETPKEAIDRVYKKEDKKESDKKKEDKIKLPSKKVSERVIEAKKQLDEAERKHSKIIEEITKYENGVYNLIEDVQDAQERNKIIDKYRKENKEKEEKLIEKRNSASADYDKAIENFKDFQNKLADEYLNIDINKIDNSDIKEFTDELKEILYLGRVDFEKKQKLRGKIDELNLISNRISVKERADKIGGYTKKLNDLCGFTELSDISEYPETLQKHIYDNYKQVYDKYPQIRYGGIQKYNLSSHTYAQNTSVKNRVVLNSSFYDDLNKLKESYERTVKSQFHPQGTDYNSIIVHELGHALLEYITKKTGKTGAEIREKVLKKLKIKQKDVKEHLSEYAMYKPRIAHEFFAEAFAEYMTSKNPRPLAAEFGKEIDNILEVYKLN